MSDSEGGFRWPYDRTPGGSGPSPHTTPPEGREDLYSFTILSLLSTGIIAVTGISVWWMVH